MLSGRVIGVGDCRAEEIAEHCRSLVERDPMLADVLGRFPRIPFEFHCSSVAVAVSAVNGWLGATGIAALIPARTAAPKGRSHRRAFFVRVTDEHGTGIRANAFSESPTTHSTVNEIFSGMALKELQPGSGMRHGPRGSAQSALPSNIQQTLDVLQLFWCPGCTRSGWVEPCQLERFVQTRDTQFVVRG